MGGEEDEKWPNAFSGEWRAREGREGWHTTLEFSASALYTPSELEVALGKRASRRERAGRQAYALEHSLHPHSQLKADLDKGGEVSKARESERGLDFT